MTPEEKKMIEEYLKKNKPSVVQHPEPMPKNGGVRQSSSHVEVG